MTRALIILAALSVIAIGFGVPAVCMYYAARYDLNIVAASIIAFIALIGGGILGIVFFGTLENWLPSLTANKESRADRERLNMLRAYLRANLEELDAVAELLKDIRDTLKQVG